MSAVGRLSELMFLHELVAPREVMQASVTGLSFVCISCRHGRNIMDITQHSAKWTWHNQTVHQHKNQTCDVDGFPNIQQTKRGQGCDKDLTSVTDKAWKETGHGTTHRPRFLVAGEPKKHFGVKQIKAQGAEKFSDRRHLPSTLVLSVLSGACNGESDFRNP